MNLNEKLAAGVEIASEKHNTSMDAIEEFAMLNGTEIVEQRGEYEKVYDLGKGRRQAIMFAAPVHYKDEAGKWQEIDNTLDTVADSDGRTILRNRGSDVRMEFDQHRSAVRISHKGRSLSWRLFNSADVSADVVSGSNLRRATAARTGIRVNANTPQEMRMNGGHKMNVEVNYANARPGLNVRYNVNGVRLKEDIILENAAAAADAAILLPDDYEYSVDERMRVHVCDKESRKPVFFFDTPVTTDANGNETVAAVTLTPCDSGIMMRYNLDPDFLENAAYPITIDPVVSTPTRREIVEDTYIYEKHPSSNYGSVYLMRSGYNGYYSISMLRFAQLPKLSASDTVISATLRLCAENYGNKVEYMGCFPIKKAWNDQTVTWNSVNASDMQNNEYISRDLLAYVPSTNNACYFNLTPIYRDWYKADAEGNSLNYGVAIYSPDGIGTDADHKYVEWATAQYDAGIAPCMIVNYVSHAGRQSIWTYESMSAGRAGEAYVDIYNGNLVYEHSDGSTTGSRMPVGLTHVYNSCLSAGNPVGCGMGWRTSMHQYVNRRTLGGNNYYVWTDGSATEHYFMISGSQPYADCEGMSLKLTTSGNALSIVDKGHNRMEFSVPSDGTQQPMLRAYDAVGNTAALSYENGLLTKITDGVGRKIAFEYNSENLLSQLTIPGSPTLTFTYAGETLTGINYADVTSGGTTFTYEADSNLLKVAKNFDGNQVEIGFEAENYYCADVMENYAQQVRRAISLEHRNGTALGAMKRIDYLHMMTKITAVNGGTPDQDKTITYHFNEAGNVICTFDELGYAISNVFEDPNTSPNLQKNASKLRKVVINKLPNIDFSAKWTAVKGCDADTVQQDTDVRCLNMPSVKIVKGGAGETSHRLNAEISAAGEYTFSAYVKNDAQLASGGLFVRIRSGENVYSSRAVTGATTSFNTDSAADGWDRIYVSAHLPAGEVSVELVSTAASGVSAWFACPQLETGSIPNHVNLLLNGDFTRTFVRGSQTFAEDWSVSEGISGRAENGVVQEGLELPSGLTGNAMRIHSYCITNQSSHCQSISVKGKKGDVFIIGGWEQATSVYSGSSNYRPCIISRFRNADGSWPDYQYNEYDVQRVGWKFAQWAIVAPNDYTEFRIGIQYARNNGTAMFTNMFIYREEFGQSFEYDSKRNVTSIASLSTQKANMTYDDSDNLISYHQPGAEESAKYTMNYGETTAERQKHLLRESVTPMGQRDTYTYDDRGNALTAIRQKSGETAFIKTESGYSADGNYRTSTKDARGNTVTQAVDPNTGTLTSVTDPNGQTVNYTYDASKRVTAVQTEAYNRLYRNRYTYENDRIKTVSHNTTGSAENDVTYTFEYDSLGRKTNVKVGEQTLSTNVYENDRAGLLSEVQYGNGGKVQYAYDDFDRLTGVRYDGEETDRYSYEYDANGNAVLVRDHALNRVLQTGHDLADRPMDTQLRNADGSLIYRTQLDYDVQNRLIGFGEETENAAYKTGYTYDTDNRITEMDFGGDDKIRYTYDSLGRVSARTVENGTDVGKLETAYSFAAGGYGEGSTTPLVESIRQPGVSFDYAYDNRGNIISEKRYAPGTAEADKLETTYEYDALGQLIRVNDPHENVTWRYIYDCGGNIIRKMRCRYTTGEDTEVIKPIPYFYLDANWGDKLTAYNEVPITYDAIGNPLSDGTRTYEWEAGRRLKRMTVQSDPAEGVKNAYDADSETTMELQCTNGNLLTGAVTGTVISANVYRRGADVTDTYAASAFSWTRNSGDAAADAIWNAAHTGMKSIEVMADSLTADVQLHCTLTSTSPGYGTIEVDGQMTASHTPGAADTGDTFYIEDGMLYVTAAENNYRLSGNDLTATYPRLNGTLTASAWVYRDQPTKTVEFAYNASGLRVQKQILTNNGKSVTINYTLHGKLITHLNMWCMDEQGAETEQDMHFFYDAQSRPAFVEYDGIRYRYLHNLQGDIVGIVDGNGNLVVEYKYDAWGRPISVTGTLKTSLGELNPFRYRGYVYDAETGLYYLKNRYYNHENNRFINVDLIVSARIGSLNLFSYCQNSPVTRADSTGTDGYYVVMNVYAPDGWNWSYGHYDLSIISKDDPEKGWTFSYGPIFPEKYEMPKNIENEVLDARVDVYETPCREDMSPAIRFLLFDDLTQQELNSFYSWFNLAYPIIDENEDGTFRRYKIDEGSYSKYCIKNGCYCGSGLAWLVSLLRNVAYESKEVQRSLNSLRKSVLRVENRVMVMFSLLLKKYPSNT